MPQKSPEPNQADRLDPPHGHPERGGDLAVVGKRAHGGAELGRASGRR